MGKFCIIISGLLLISCQDSPSPPESKPVVYISSNGVSCTEAWLQLKLENIQLPADAKVFQSDSIVYIIEGIKTMDSVIVIDSLMPGRTYSLQFTINSSGKEHRSNSIEVRTLDTTSHNFIWESWTFGDIGYSTFYDAAIISANDIWCVGEIKLRDTSENGYSIYNSVHWDGNEWTLKKFMFYTICGQSHQNAYPASAIQVFPENQILIAHRGDQITKLVDGVQVITMCVPGSMLIFTMWGKSVDDFYVAGYKGQIAHYENGKWTKLNSGTEYNINDIRGDYNEITGEWEVIAVAGNITEGNGSERVILKITDNNVEHMKPARTQYPLASIWFKSSQKYLITGSGIYIRENHYPFEYLKQDPQSTTNYHINSIYADGLNNLLAAGAYGEVIHFNGLTWKSYIDQTFIYGNYYGIHIKDDLLILTGYSNANAVVTMGKR